MSSTMRHTVFRLYQTKVCTARNIRMCRQFGILAIKNLNPIRTSYEIPRTWLPSNVGDIKTCKQFGSTASAVTKHVVKQADVTSLGSGSGIRVHLDSSEYIYPSVWLRDNCQCEACFHPEAIARLVLMRNVDPNISPNDIKVDQSGSSIKITWSDDHTGIYDANWLYDRRFSENAAQLQKTSLSLKARLWSADLHNIPSDSLNNLLSDDRALYRWLCGLEEVGLFRVTGAGTEDGQCERLAQRVAFLRTTNYGSTFFVRSKIDASNVAYTSATLGLHTDLPFYNCPPGMQMLHCQRQVRTQGGDNEFADGFHIAELMRRDHPEEFHVLATTPVDFIDIGEDFYKYHKLTMTPIIRLNSAGEVTRITYNNQVRDSRLSVPAEQVPALYRALRLFDDLLYAKENIIRLKMDDGDIICFDNNRVLHGRQGYETCDEGERSLEGGYIEWDELRSRRRVLHKELGDQE